MYTYKAKVYKVVDGDTFYATVDLGFRIIADQKFRLEGIDTPEIFRPKTNEEYEAGLKAKKFVEDLILDREVVITTYKNVGIYGRYQAKVETYAGDLTDLLIENGFEK